MTTVVHSGEPLGKRVRRKYPDREPSHLVESRFGSFLFFFFPSCYLPAWPMATTSSIECPFPSFISGNYHRLPSGKTVSGTILIVPTYQEPFRAIRGYFIVPLSSNFYLYFSHPFPSLTNISLRSSKYDSVDFYVTIFRLESKAIDRKLRRFSNIPHAREI